MTATYRVERSEGKWWLIYPTDLPGFAWVRREISAAQARMYESEARPSLFGDLR